MTICDKFIRCRHYSVTFSNYGVLGVRTWGEDVGIGMIAEMRFGVTKLGLLLATVVLGPTSAMSHDNDQHCGAIIESVKMAGFTDEVTVMCEDGHAIIVSDTYPDHPLMTGIVATNEQVPVPAKDYTAPIPLRPVLGETPQTRDAALGIAVNGVPIYDYTGGGEMSVEDLHHHQIQHDTILTQQLDICGGHAGRGDDYHYHTKPVCMIERMENAGDDAIIGWAFDGFPIYGDNNPNGSVVPSGQLDVCNGQSDETFGYRYHTSTDAPYIIQCLMGKVADILELPRVSPLKSPSSWWGGGKDAGRPPRGGVEDLVFIEDGTTGMRSVDYTFQGEAYYMRYTPTETPHCYAFVTRTVTNNGEIETEDYCR